jgi:type IV pilus assembly protein PilB
MSSRHRLGEILIDLGVLSDDNLKRALEIQNQQEVGERFPIGRILLEEGFIEPNDLIEAIKIQTSQEQISL